MRIVDLEIIGHTIKEIEKNAGKIIKRIRFTKDLDVVEIEFGRWKMINEEDKFAGLPEHLQSYGGEIRIAKGGIFEAKEFVCYPEDEIKVIAEGIVESDSTTCKSLRDFVSNIDGFTSLPIKENLKGKKVQIIIREVTNQD